MVTVGRSSNRGSKFNVSNLREEVPSPEFSHLTSSLHREHMSRSLARSEAQSLPSWNLSSNLCGSEDEHKDVAGIATSRLQDHAPMGAGNSVTPNAHVYEAAAYR